MADTGRWPSGTPSGSAPRCTWWTPGSTPAQILAQATFDVTDQDTIATYPDLHLIHGLALLGTQVDRVLAGRELEPVPAGIAPGSGLYYHPTLWGYLWRRWRHGVR